MRKRRDKSLMDQPPWWLCLLIVLIAVGYVMWRHTPFNRFPAAVLKALRQDDHAMLYSLEPYPEMNSDSPHELLHRYPVVGKTQLSSAQDREMLADMLEKSPSGEREALACFEPRHALRVKARRAPMISFSVTRVGMPKCICRMARSRIF